MSSDELCFGLNQNDCRDMSLFLLRPRKISWLYCARITVKTTTVRTRQLQLRNIFNLEKEITIVTRRVHGSLVMGHCNHRLITTAIFKTCSGYQYSKPMLIQEC